jgi:pSer/pThr/pTyr-binding forkhead associated (FHA) protein
MMQAEDPPSEPAEEGDSSMQADQADQTDQTDQADQADPANSNMEDDEQIVTQVTQHLISPETPVQASQDHSNSIHESNKDGVKAYAKIAALDWTYYVTKLVVNIGRSSDPTQRRAEPDPAADESQDTAVHIDLGPSKLISREHASIFFNSNEAKWWLKVKGRNALKVNGTSWKPSDAGPLESGDVIEIGGVEMMFVLPPELSPLRVGKQYLERANLTRLVASKASRLVRHPLPSGDSHRSPSSPGKSQRSQGSQRSLAPAPPDYKRPGTPPSMRARLAATKSPHAELSGSPLMLSNNDLDLSLDENRHIKPQYSYAQMITQAIMSTEEEKLNLSGIYTFILNRYSYYRNQTPSGWQVRDTGRNPRASLTFRRIRFDITFL